MRAFFRKWMSSGQVRATEGLALAIVLGLVLLAVSYLRIIGDTNSALFGSDVRIAPLEQPLLGTELFNRLTGFAGALLVLHAALGTTAWSLAWLSKRAWQNSPSSQRTWTCLWLAAITVWVLAANAAWFPMSSLGSPYASFVRLSIAGVDVFQLLSMLLVIALAVTGLRFLWLDRPNWALPRPAVVLAAGAVLAGVYLNSLREPTIWTRASAQAVQPNVILIGLDSLRTDLLQDDGPDSPTPALNEFLREAAIFTDTTTPLARTFAAWVSIITGRHPHTTGATVNLIPRELINTGQTLPEILGEAGYETVYGIDEVRFSNIDESYGFDRTVGPRIGSADFLIQFFGDTPVSNLIVNTWLGDLLFPELHGNRAAKVTYDPDTFVRDLERNLYFDTPTLLAVHLTLAHWPYTWATSGPESRGDLTADRIPVVYAAAVRRLDRQFASLMAMLERKGALDNAIVIVLSDHGESLGERSSLAGPDTEISPLLGSPLLYGHGTHVFSRDQYNVLLSIRTFGQTPLEVPTGGAISYPATLEDITPTLLDALDLNAADAFDGRSLLPSLKSGHRHAYPEDAGRIRFIETEFNPPGVAIDQQLSASAIAKASASYRIDPKTDRVEVRPEHLARILDSRQYAAALDDRLLASIPAANGRDQHLVYVESRTAGPVWLDAPLDPTAAPELKVLWQALRERFEPVTSRSVVGPPPAPVKGPIE